MAQRRMFSMKIIDTDKFLEMPQTTRLLYYDLCMRADDDGFVASPKKIMRMVGCSEDDLRILFGKSYIIPFESGICVVKHWKIHNYIQSDRYQPTEYKEEKAKLLLLDNKYELDTKCIQNVSEMSPNLDTQDRLGKDRLGKDRDNIGNSFQKLIGSYTENEELRKTIFDFLDHRKSIKKPVKTIRTLELILKELDKHSNKIEVLNQSIMNGWQGLFEIKQSKKESTGNNIFYEIGKERGLWQ